MAYKKELIQWALLNASRLGLEVKNSTWIREFSSSLTDVTVQFTVGSENHFGYGAAETQDLALTKALAEAAERVVVKAENFPTSNGVAAHLDRMAAEFGAVEELKERDLILCHFYTSTPFARMNTSVHDFVGLELLEEWYHAHGVAFGVFKLGHQGTLFVADGRTANKPFGFVLGAGRKNSLRESIAAAAIEASRQVALIVAGNEVYRPLSLEQFLAIGDPSFFNHGQLGLDLDYANQISHLFENETNHEAAEFASAVTVREISNLPPELNDCPLCFIRAQSNLLQDLHRGRPTEDKLNFQRLSQFRGLPVTMSNILNLPHPFN